MINYSEEFMNELNTAAKIRAAIYGYLYKIFKAPVDESFMELTEKFIPSFTALIDIIDNENIKEAVKYFEKYNKNETSAKDKISFINELNKEYTTLFLLGKGSIPTSASVFLSPENLIKGDAWEKVCQIYYKRGYILPEDFKEPEDHIAAEIQYMQKLNELIIQFIENNSFDNIKAVLEEQKDFLDNHILTWVGDFARLAASKAGDKPLYTGASLLTMEFTAYDTELIQEFLNEM